MAAWEPTVVYLGWGRGRSLSDRSASTEEREESTARREIREEPIKLANCTYQSNKKEKITSYITNYKIMVNYYTNKNIIINEYF